MAACNSRPAEQWRPVPREKFCDIYEVSDFGRVRRLVADAYGRYPVGFELKPGLNKDGYLTFALSHPQTGGWNVPSHRLVAMAFLGPAPTPQHVVAHGDGNRINNRVTNLRWATATENSADTRRHGNIPNRVGWSTAGWKDGKWSRPKK